VSFYVVQVALRERSATSAKGGARKDVAIEMSTRPNSKEADQGPAVIVHAIEI